MSPMRRPRRARGPFLLNRLRGRFLRPIGSAFPGGTLSRLLGGRLLLRRGVFYWWCVFEIACQISLTPRPVTAENGSGSACCRMAFIPCDCSD